MPAYRLQPWQDTKELLERLEAEIAECKEVRSCEANKVKKFMAANGIWRLKELDYLWRQAYEEFLTGEVRPESNSKYLKAFDRLKRHTLGGHIQRVGGMEATRPAYENQLLYLPYHPNPGIRERFDFIVCRENMVWDFSLPAPERMKRQVFDILHHLLEQNTGRKTQRKLLTQLRRFYAYCAETGIKDIEILEKAQAEEFVRLHTNGAYAEEMAGIVDYSRKALFLEGKEIHWQAHIWYLERFHLQPERTDPSRPIESLSFLEVTNPDHRALLKKYMRYNIGITNLSMSSIRSDFLYVRDFLANLRMSGDVRQISDNQMKQELNRLEEKRVKPESYNRTIMALEHFFRFLQARGDMEKLPFQRDYCLKKTFLPHHDRSVAETAAIEILQNLRYFPEEIRLMYLHLWAAGLRISEVCALKGNAYSMDGRDAWLQVYQNKMKSYKRIPIPTALYQLMQVYLKRHKIQPDGYVFRNRKGGAYYSGTFRKKMLECCESCRIQNGDYLFRSHDYRHSAATRFYDNKVSIQAIRDYLGHRYEEMTRKYIDYMPMKIDLANEEFFKESGGGLAACLGKGEDEG